MMAGLAVVISVPSLFTSTFGEGGSQLLFLGLLAARVSAPMGHGKPMGEVMIHSLRSLHAGESQKIL